MALHIHAFVGVHRNLTCDGLDMAHHAPILDGSLISIV
jgi:hypothetical protein